MGATACWQPCQPQGVQIIEVQDDENMPAAEQQGPLVLSPSLEEQRSCPHVTS